MIGAGAYAMSQLTSTTSIASSSSNTTTESTLADSASLLQSSSSLKTSSSGETSATQSVGPCQYYPPLTNSSQMIFFATNSTAKICVTIFNYNPVGYHVNYTWTADPNLELYDSQNSSWSSEPQVDVYSNLSVSVEPFPINVVPSTNSSYTYILSPKNGTQGIYNLEMPTNCWQSFMFILAVGYSTAEFQSFIPHIPYLAPPLYGCSAFNGNIVVTGTANLTPIS
jgi:hypothetical protein